MWQSLVNIFVYSAHRYQMQLLLVLKASQLLNLTVASVLILPKIIVHIHVPPSLGYVAEAIANDSCSKQSSIYDHNVCNYQPSSEVCGSTLCQVYRHCHAGQSYEEVQDGRWLQCCSAFLGSSKPKSDWSAHVSYLQKSIRLVLALGAY